MDLELFADEMNAASENGFGFYSLVDPDVLTTYVIFTVGALNDGVGIADYAFAGLAFDKIPDTPVPAALPLLLNGDAGLGFARRRRPPPRFARNAKSPKFSGSFPVRSAAVFRTNRTEMNRAKHRRARNGAAAIALVFAVILNKLRRRLVAEQVFSMRAS